MPFLFSFMMVVVSFLWLCYGTAVEDVNIQVKIPYGFITVCLTCTFNLFSIWGISWGGSRRGSGCLVESPKLQKLSVRLLQSCLHVVLELELNIATIKLVWHIYSTFYLHAACIKLFSRWFSERLLSTRRNKHKSKHSHSSTIVSVPSTDYGSSDVCVSRIEQFRYIKIQPNTIDVSKRLWEINPTSSVVISQGLVLRFIVLGWI